MKEKMINILDQIPKVVDNYGSGLSIRFKDDGRTLGILRYGKVGSKYMLLNGDVSELIDRLDQDIHFGDGDLPVVDGVIREYCLGHIKQM
jgi:hypothetical protein